MLLLCLHRAKLEETGPLKLWKSVRDELRTIWDLLPMLERPLYRAAAGAIATDATGVGKDGRAGIGATYARDFPLEQFTAEGWSDSFKKRHEDVEWQWAVAMAHKSTSPVYMQEMLGFLLGLRVAERHGFDGSRGELLMFNDNQAVVGAVTKGRSSKKGLNCLLRRYCAFVLLNGWYLPWVTYIPTKENPADAPSRVFRLRERKEVMRANFLERRE